MASGGRDRGGLAGRPWAGRLPIWFGENEPPARMVAAQGVTVILTEADVGPEGGSGPAAGPSPRLPAPARACHSVAGRLS